MVFVTGVYATKYQNSKKREKRKKKKKSSENHAVAAKSHQLQIVSHPLSKTCRRNTS